MMELYNVRKVRETLLVDRRQRGGPKKGVRSAVESAVHC